MFKTYSSSSSLVITSRWFAASHLVAPVSVRLVYYPNQLAPKRGNQRRLSFDPNLTWWAYQAISLLSRPGTLSAGGLIVARLSKSLGTLTLGSSKKNQHCWRFHGSGVIVAPQIIGLISFCTGMHHEYFFEVVNVLSCSPFMFENTENKQLTGEFATVIWRLHCFTVSFRGERPRRIRPQITRLSQLENSAMGTWPIYKNSIIPDWFKKWRDIKFWYRC